MTGEAACGRILAVDPGDRRIGLAVSDEFGITAQGLETFDRRDGGDFLEHVTALVDRYGVREIVVGNPVRTSGEPGTSSEKAREMAAELHRRLGIEVTLWDERFSSAEARRVTRGARAAKGTIDRVAAALILQGYLDYLRRDG